MIITARASCRFSLRFVTVVIYYADNIAVVLVTLKTVFTFIFRSVWSLHCHSEQFLSFISIIFTRTIVTIFKQSSLPHGNKFDRDRFDNKLSNCILCTLYNVHRYRVSKVKNNTWNFWTMTLHLNLVVWWYIPGHFSNSRTGYSYI